METFSPETVKQIIKAILKSPDKLKWSVQGLGMMRTYLSQEVRLHIWDSALKVPNASPLHDHPWHLDSYIVAGEVRQYRYALQSPPPVNMVYTPETKVDKFRFATILCGEGACTMSEPQDVWLQQQPLETYNRSNVP